MISNGQSDIALTMRLGRQQSNIRLSLDVVGKSLSTGEKGDLVAATSGDLARLFSIEHSLIQLGAEKDAISVALGKAGLAQLSFDRIHESIKDTGAPLLSAIERNDFSSMTIIAKNAQNGLETAVNALNVRYGRHSIFAGASLDSPAIASAQVMLDDVSIIIAGSVDAATALTLIDTYFFDPAGEFETNVYLGASQDGPPLKGVEELKIYHSKRADLVEIRETLRALTIAAVSAEAPNFLGTIDQNILLREAAMSSIKATGFVVNISQDLGFAEGRISEEQARNQAQYNMYSLERLSIVAADPYEAATMFEALEGQLQSVYQITVRLSKLSLNNFLR